MKIVVGLGNPGVEYKNTRHNVGFIVLDSFAQDEGLNWNFEEKFNAQIAKSLEYMLVKPMTFMNNSGACVSKIVNFYKTSLDDLTVVYDDADLKFGQYRYKKGGGTAGHHGVNDIVEKLGSYDFWRFRVGIDRPKDDKFDIEDWVLTDFAPEELTIVKGFGLNFKQILSENSFNTEV